MSDYPIALLGDLAKPERAAIAIGPFGSRMKANIYVPAGVPVIRGTNISSERSLKGDWVYVPEDFAATIPSCALQGGDLVFPHRGSIGEVALVEPSHAPMILSSSMMKFRPDPRRLDGRFAYYFFKSKVGREEILRFGSQVGTPGIGQPLTSLKQFRIPLPPLEQQAEIADVLAALDDKIELNRRMNETLEATARTIFKDWFVDFGPVRAKMAMRGEDPQKDNVARAPYLAADIWSLFPDRLDHEVKPEGWSVSIIGQEVDVVGGSTPSTKEAELWGGEIAWATPKDLSSLSTPVLLSTERQITDAGLSQIGSGLLPAGTVLLSSRAPIGYIAIAQIPVAVNQGLIAMICRKRLSNAFVWLWTQANMETVHQNANGSTFQEISKANFRPIVVTVPAGNILGAFDGVAKPLLGRIISNDKENRALAATRDFLLPKLMSGEVRVKDAEKIVGEAT